MTLPRCTASDRWTTLKWKSLAFDHRAAVEWRLEMFADYVDIIGHSFIHSLPVVNDILFEEQAALPLNQLHEALGSSKGISACF